MQKHRLDAVAIGILILTGCAPMSTTSWGGWTTLLDRSKGFDENWTKIGEANWRIVDGVAGR